MVKRSIINHIIPVPFNPLCFCEAKFYKFVQVSLFFSGFLRLYFVQLTGAQSSRLRRSEKIRIRVQFGEIIQGVTPIFKVFGPLLMVSDSTSSKELKNLMKLRIAFTLSFSEVGKKFGVP